MVAREWRGARGDRVELIGEISGWLTYSGWHGRSHLAGVGGWVPTVLRFSRDSWGQHPCCWSYWGGHLEVSRTGDEARVAVT